MTGNLRVEKTSRDRQADTSRSSSRVPKQKKPRVVSGFLTDDSEDDREILTPASATGGRSRPSATSVEPTIAPSHNKQTSTSKDRNEGQKTKANHGAKSQNLHGLKPHYHSKKGKAPSTQQVTGQFSQSTSGNAVEKLPNSDQNLWRAIMASTDSPATVSEPIMENNASMKQIEVDLEEGELLEAPQELMPQVPVSRGRTPSTQKPGRRPWLFIPGSSVPVGYDFKLHLEKRLQGSAADISFDEEGYKLTWNHSSNPLYHASYCYRTFNGHTLFDHFELKMIKHNFD